jgi:hypothetical protein
MAPQEKVAPVVAALAKLGVDVGEAHKAELVQMLENVADPDAKTMMDAFAANLVEHGIAGAFQNAERNDITSSEGAAIAMINANIEGGADALLAWGQKVAGGG